MAGITGIIAHGSDDLRPIGAMTELLAHRGPAGDGLLWLLENGKLQTRYNSVPGTGPVPAIAALGHRAQHGTAQPLNDGPLWLVMDGDAHPAAVLSAYRSHGIDSIANIPGSFALALLDTNARTLTLARDRFGIKPLYYWAHRGRLALASEIKALFALPEIRPKLERHAMEAMLANLPIHGKTAFAHIHEFPAGHHAVIPLDSATHLPAPTAYWQPPATEKINETDAANRFRELLFALPHPAGICLSGGMHSTALAIAMRHKVGDGEALNSFTTLFEEPELDARVWVTSANSAAHTMANWVMPEADDFMTELDTLLWHHDLPFSSPGTYAQWCLMRAATDAKITHLVDGLGAHTLLTAPPHPTTRFERLRDKLSPAYRAETRAMARLAPRLTVPGEHDAAPALPILLRSTDRNANAFSREVHFPFLTTAMADFCLRLPLAQRTSLLRTALGDRIPEPIMNRPATPWFGTPIHRWMQTSILPAFMSDIKHARLPLVPVIDGGALREMITHQLDRPDVARTPLLFRLFIMNRWMQRFNVAPAS